MNDVERLAREARRRGMSYGQYAATLPRQAGRRPPKEPRQEGTDEAAERRCPECGRLLPRDTHPNRKYCGPACGQAARKRMKQEWDRKHPGRWRGKH